MMGEGKQGSHRMDGNLQNGKGEIGVQRKILQGGALASQRYSSKND